MTSTPVTKNLVVVLSDIHIAENSPTTWYQRAIHGPYLRSIFDWIVANSASIKEVVLAGDVVDFWTYPFHMRPPAFAEIVQQNPEVFGRDGLGRLLDALQGAVKYMPGNHDMAIRRSDMGAVVSPGGHRMKFVVGPYFPVRDKSIVITHGHDYTVFNAPDHFSKWRPLPLGHFVTRMIATRAAREGTTVSQLSGQGNPNSMNLAPIVTPLIGTLLTAGQSTIRRQLLEAVFAIPAAILEQVRAFADVSDSAPILLANGRTTNLTEVTAVYADLIRRWTGQFDLQYAMKSIMADADGTYMGWFAQRLAMEVGAQLVVMGHTHTPISGLSGSEVRYVNSGFACPAEPDMTHQSISFAVIDITTRAATLKRAVKVGRNITIQPCPADTAPVVYALADYSCLVTISNDSDDELLLASVDVGHGHFVVAPPTSISSRSTAGIWLQDYPGVHGCDARVTYRSATGVHTFVFDCPTGLSAIYANACSGGTSFVTKAGGGAWSRPNRVVEEGHPLHVRFTVATTSG